MCLNEIERQGVWPESLERALVSLISKGEGDEPADLRPISVMSTIYRLWAAIRLQDVMVWPETWTPTPSWACQVILQEGTWYCLL